MIFEFQKKKGDLMQTEKALENEYSQTERIPEESENRLDDDKVATDIAGKVSVPFPKTGKWSKLLASLDMFSEDIFTDEREQGVQAGREPF